MRVAPNVMADEKTKDGSVVADRLAFLFGKRVRVRVWWNSEAQAASPAGDEFEAVLLNIVPIGRDYYFVFSTVGDNPKRYIIKTAAVLQVSEV